MQEYLLFIDTETSGLPRKWNVPYSQNDNWPYALQIAWIIYTKEKKLVKQENHYIWDHTVKISPAAQNIHGITQSFLHTNGESKKEVLQLLLHDLKKFQPLIIGHFIKFDFHILGVEFYRTGIDNPIKQLPTFCTMLATRHLVLNPARKHMPLCNLYELLFKTPLKNGHNALADATATADCFFELMRKGEINEAKIEGQKNRI